MKAIALIAGAVLSIAAATQQGLSREDIAKAIEEGRAGKTLQKKCSASTDNGFEIVIEGPVGRVMRAADAAKRDNRDFTPGDVTPAMARPVLIVTTRRDATLNAPSSDYQYLESASTGGYSFRGELVLRSRSSGSDKPVVLTPSERLLFTPSERVLYGSGAPSQTAEKPAALWTPFPRSNMIAGFDLAAFRALPAGAVDVVAFMTDTGELRCTISEKDRAKIR